MGRAARPGRELEAALSGRRLRLERGARCRERAWRAVRGPREARFVLRKRSPSCWGRAWARTAVTVSGLIELGFCCWKRTEAASGLGGPFPEPFRAREDLTGEGEQVEARSVTSAAAAAALRRAGFS